MRVGGDERYRGRKRREESNRVTTARSTYMRLS